MKTASVAEYGKVHGINAESTLSGHCQGCKNRSTLGDELMREEEHSVAVNPAPPLRSGRSHAGCGNTVLLVLNKPMDNVDNKM